MTASGGDNGEGVVFSFDPAAPTPTCTATPTSGSSERVVLSFNPAAPDADPYAYPGIFRNVILFRVCIIVDGQGAGMDA